MKFKITLTGSVLIAISIAGCSNRQLYTMGQENTRFSCNKLPQEEYDDCMKKTSKTYNEYQVERNEVIKSK